MPSLFLYPGDEFQNEDDMEIRHSVKRSQFPVWIHKRNPALCDYRLQLRPLPYTSALCAYSEYKSKLIQ